MKFLMIIEGVPSGTHMPPEESLPFAKAIYAWVRKIQETRKAEVVYALADHAGGVMGGVFIINYESAEQLAQDLATFPGVGCSTVRVYPLVAPEVTEKLIEAGLEALPKK